MSPTEFDVATEALYPESINAEAAAFIGAALARKGLGSDSATQGDPPTRSDNHGWEGGIADPETAARVVLPSLLESRPRVDQALYAVGMEASVHGFATRKVDDLLKALAADTGISKSEVSSEGERLAAILTDSSGVLMCTNDGLDTAYDVTFAAWTHEDGGFVAPKDIVAP